MSIHAKLAVKWVVCNALGALMVIGIAFGLANLIKTEIANLAVLIIIIVYFCSFLFAVIKARPDTDNYVLIWILCGAVTPIIVLSVILAPNMWDVE